MNENEGKNGRLLLLESYIGVAWCILIDGWLAQTPVHTMWIFGGFASLAMVVWWTKRIGIEVIWSIGGVVTCAGSVSTILVLGIQPVSLAILLLLCASLHRSYKILVPKGSVIELYRNFFIFDSLALPTVSAFCFYHSLERDVAALALVGSAAVGLLVIRLISLRLVIKVDTQVPRLRFRELLMMVGVVAFVIISLGGSPYALLLLSWLAVPVLYVLQPLIDYLHNLFFSKQHIQSGDAFPKWDFQKLLREENVNSGNVGVAIPDWAWGAIFGTVVLLVLINWLRKEYRVNVERNSNDYLHIRTIKWVPQSEPLMFQETSSSIRKAYQGMLRWYEKKGLPIFLYETAREYEARLRLEGKIGGDEATKVKELTKSYEDERYEGRQETKKFGIHG